MPEPTKLTLTYFQVAGRAEAIRLAAAVGKVAFVNKVIGFSEFSNMKTDLPLGQVPILEMEYADGKTETVTQSDAILRYFGKRGGCYPEDPAEAIKVDAVLVVLEESTTLLRTTMRGAVRALLSTTEWTTEEKLTIRKRWLDEDAPKYFGFLEKQIESTGSGWLVGDNLTIADLQLFALCEYFKSGIMDGVPSTMLNDYPRILETSEKVRSSPGVSAWYDKYQKPYNTFDYSP